MSLRKKTVSGLFWMSVNNIVTNITKFGCQLVLARILTPQDFGIASIGFLVISAMGLLNGLGIETALVQHKDEADEVYSTAFTVVSILGFILFLLGFLSAPFIADFYRQPQLSVIIRLLSLAFLINTFSLIPKALLTKNMEFGRKNISDIGSIFVYAVVSIILAIKLKNVFAIIYGYLALVAANLALLWLTIKTRPKFKLNMKYAGQLIRYGKFVVGASILSLALTQGDNALVGRMLGITVLGFYALAYTLSNVIASEMTHAVSNVMFPVFSKFQDEHDRLKKAYLMTIELVLLLVIPVSLGTISMGNDIIKILLGEKWLPCVPVMRILCFHGFFRAIHIISCYLLDAAGKPKLHKNIILWELVGLILIIYPLTLKFGILGTGFSVTITRLIACLATVGACLKIINIRWIGFLNILAAPLLSGILMVAVVILMKSFVLIPVSPVNCALIVVIAAVAYVSAAVVLCGGIRSEIRKAFLIFSFTS